MNKIDVIKIIGTLNKMTVECSYECPHCEKRIYLIDPAPPSIINETRFKIKICEYCLGECWFDIVMGYVISVSSVIFKKD